VPDAFAPRPDTAIDLPFDAVESIPGPDTVDSVERAAATPDHPQPWADLGLDADEYARIREILGRRPTSSELAMYSVMWSEHCSYKSSKVHLRRFGELSQETPLGKTLAGIGENAGVIDIGQGYAVTFKVESHNHPSYVEPYQGAATGVGGIVRDILAMGARPVAVMDPLRFGPLHAPDTARVLPGIVAGVGGYGNCLGLPNIGGEVVFDPTYAGNPLVNALCVGVLRHEQLHTAQASGAGNLVVLYGARTGGDGIGGVSVLASETFAAAADGQSGGPTKRPSVQVGDPFMEKLLIECTLELFEEGLVDGIQDLGGAGLSCATSELASAGDGGMRVELDRVPLRDSSLAPEEILMSESQERMMAVVEPEKVERFLAVCARWEVDATVIGEVVTGGRLLVSWHGQTVVDVPPRTVAHEGPVYDRPYARPVEQDTLQADAAERLSRPAGGEELRATLLRLAGSPNLADKSWVTDQYDRYVRGNTVLAQPEDAGVVRVDEETGLGIALSTDCNGRFCRLDPYEGARLALAEAYRNVAVVGAQPLAVTDCLNFGSPEDPAVMWQFERAVQGLTDGCRELGLPVTGGNVSFYNQTGATAILPTPVVGVLGVLDDVTTRLRQGFAAGGHAVWLLGSTREELSGSEWAHVVHHHLGGRPPVADLSAEQALGDLLRAAARMGLLSAAHDLSDGGLGQGLVEACLRHGIGVEVTVPDGLDPFVALFSESTARALVALDPVAEERFVAAAAARGVPHTRLGVTTAGDAGAALTVAGAFTVALPELRAAWSAALPAALRV
jgi:phosphoribosylformylglycinamidine synthase